MRSFPLGVLAALALAASGCGKPCSYGPSFIEKRNIAAVSGQPIDARLSLDPGGDGGGGQLHFLSTSNLPAGLDAALEADGVHLTGSVSQAGSYRFTLLLRQEQDNACGPWGRFDVTLDVAG
ncbi:MAG: hypothetical protein ACYC8T_27060 [Myxococcaceae bacterium]